MEAGRVKLNVEGLIEWGSFSALPQLSLSEARQHLKEQNVKERSNDRYVRLLIPGQALLTFYGERLKRVSFSAVHPPSPSWAHWSREGELARKKQNDAFLVQSLGRPHTFKGENPFYQFAWGSVLSCVDPKNATAHIVITYR